MYVKHKQIDRCLREFKAGDVVEYGRQFFLVTNRECVKDCIPGRVCVCLTSGGFLEIGYASPVRAVKGSFVEE